MEPNRHVAANLYPQLLGAAWGAVDEAVRWVHSGEVPIHAMGSFQIQHGNGWLVRCLLWFMQVPPATEAVQTRLVITTYGQGERWSRSFGERSLVTTQEARAGGLLGERFGLVEFRFRLEVTDGSLLYHQVGAALCLGPWRVPLPRWMTPQVMGQETPGGGLQRTHVIVKVWAPLVGLLISYEGVVERHETLR